VAALREKTGGLLLDTAATTIRKLKSFKSGQSGISTDKR
jgi:hypothetical protein